MKDMLTRRERWNLMIVVDGKCKVCMSVVVELVGWECRGVVEDWTSMKAGKICVARGMSFSNYQCCSLFEVVYEDPMMVQDSTRVRGVPDALPAEPAFHQRGRRSRAARYNMTTPCRPVKLLSKSGQRIDNITSHYPDLFTAHQVFNDLATLTSPFTSTVHLETPSNSYPHQSSHLHRSHSHSTTNSNHAHLSCFCQ